MRGGLVVVALAACGDSSPKRIPESLDAFVPPDPCKPPELCNVFTQTGCYPEFKCTSVGRGFDVSCAPNGTVPAGGRCRTAPSTCGGGYIDDCTRGLLCVDGFCRPFCDPAGVFPLCEVGTTCVAYIFENVPVIGTCNPVCDPRYGCEPPTGR